MIQLLGAVDEDGQTLHLATSGSDGEISSHIKNKLTPGMRTGRNTDDSVGLYDLNNIIMLTKVTTAILNAKSNLYEYNWMTINKF